MDEFGNKGLIPEPYVKKVCMDHVVWWSFMKGAIIKMKSLQNFA